MERVAFLIEKTGERVFAMINPDELTFERQSGVAMRSRDQRPLAPARRSDDPMIVTGGGITDLKLNLLFDVDLLNRHSAGFSQAPDYRTNIHAPPTKGSAPLSAATDQTAAAAVETQRGAQESIISDVRTLSRPLWSLTENDDPDAIGPPVVNFIWGAAWNMPCVALSVAEKFDFFSSEGVPLRSWMRIHLRRTARPERNTPAAVQTPLRESDLAPMRDPLQERDEAAESLLIVDPVSSSRPDLLCNGVYGDVELMHALMDYNEIDDFWALECGSALMTPPAAVLREDSK